MIRVVESPPPSTGIIVFYPGVLEYFIETNPE